VARLRALAADTKLNIHRGDRTSSKAASTSWRARHRTGMTRFRPRSGAASLLYRLRIRLHAKGNGVEPLVAAGAMMD